MGFRSSPRPASSGRAASESWTPRVPERQRRPEAPRFSRQRKRRDRRALPVERVVQVEVPGVERIVGARARGVRQIRFLHLVRVRARRLPPSAHGCCPATNSGNRPPRRKKLASSCRVRAAAPSGDGASDLASPTPGESRRRRPARAPRSSSPRNVGPNRYEAILSANLRKAGTGWKIVTNWAKPRLCAPSVIFAREDDLVPWRRSGREVREHRVVDARDARQVMSAKQRADPIEMCAGIAAIVEIDDVEPHANSRPRRGTVDLELVDDAGPLGVNHPSDQRGRGACRTDAPGRRAATSSPSPRTGRRRCRSASRARTASSRRSRTQRARVRRPARPVRARRAQFPARRVADTHAICPTPIAGCPVKRMALRRAIPIDCQRVDPRRLVESAGRWTVQEPEVGRKRAVRPSPLYTRRPARSGRGDSHGAVRPDPHEDESSFELAAQIAFVGKQVLQGGQSRRPGCRAFGLWTLTLQPGTRAVRRPARRGTPAPSPRRAAPTNERASATVRRRPVPPVAPLSPARETDAACLEISPTWPAASSARRAREPGARAARRWPAACRSGDVRNVGHGPPCHKAVIQPASGHAEWPSSAGRR